MSKYAPSAGRRELQEAKAPFRRWAKVMEAHSRASRDTLAEMVKGKQIEISYDTREPAKDRYGRLLIYVTLDGRDVNAEMIKRGLAVADTRFSCDRLEEYVKLWRAAQAARVGIWASLSKDNAAEDKAHREGAAPPAPSKGLEFWASRKSDKYHLPTCRSAKKIKAENLMKFKSVKEAREAGYEPCKACKPPPE